MLPKKVSSEAKPGPLGEAHPAPAPYHWRQLTDLLKPGQDIALMVHERPDGDAYGSALGLAIILRSLGFCPRFLRARKPVAFTWLPGQELIEVVEAAGWQKPPEETQVLVLDCGEAERCEYFLGNKQPLLNADHHITNPGFGVLNWVDVRAGATAEVLCRLLSEAGVPIPPEAATCLLTALITDTGWFKFSSAGVGTMRSAALLMELGADMELIRENLWENRPFSELLLLEEVMRHYRLFHAGKAVICSLPCELLKEKGIMDAETDNTMEMIRGVEGVEVTALLKETEPGTIKGSLRSKYFLDCSALAGQVGGGGHVRAAGCTIKGTLAEAERVIMDLLDRALDGIGGEKR